MVHKLDGGATYHFACDGDPQQCIGSVNCIINQVICSTILRNGKHCLYRNNTFNFFYHAMYLGSHFS